MIIYQNHLKSFFEERVILLLTTRTVESTATAKFLIFNFALAFEARLPFSLINSKEKLVFTLGTIRTKIFIVLSSRTTG